MAVTRPVAVKLDESIHARVQKLAEAMDRSTHHLMCEAIAQYVEREEKPEALLDVQRCYRFLAADNPAAASRAVRALREGMRLVAEHPEAGRPVERMDPEFRERLIGFGDSGCAVASRDYFCPHSWLLTRKRCWKVEAVGEGRPRSAPRSVVLGVGA